jgi:hypothetical protein
MSTRYRYCEMCDEWFASTECPECGAATVDPDREPREDGEAFRGGEATAYEREQMADILRTLK